MAKATTTNSDTANDLIKEAGGTTEVKTGTQANEENKQDPPKVIPQDPEPPKQETPRPPVIEPQPGTTNQQAAAIFPPQDMVLNIAQTPSLIPTAEQMAEDMKDAPLEILKNVKQAVDTELTRRGEITAPIETPEPVVDSHQQLQKMYGEDYIHAKQPDGRETYFSAEAWKGLPGNKDGWEQQVKTPPEVLALQNK